ncbi:T9SS type A sorting domain-containing protein [Wenyingzhuangia sp. IMCC45533]
MKKLLLITPLLFSLFHISNAQENKMIVADNMNVSPNTYSNNFLKGISNPTPEKKSPQNSNKTTHSLIKNKHSDKCFNEHLVVESDTTEDYISIKTISNSTIKIYNKRGKVIKTYNNSFGESYIDTRDLIKGIYYITIAEPDTKTVVKKLEIK